VQKIVVKASQNSTNNANYNYWDDIYQMIPYSNTAHIKHDKPSCPKKSTFPSTAYFNKSPEHHHHNRRAEECSPEESTPPPCSNLFKRKEDTTHWSSESCTNSRGCTVGYKITAVPVVVEVANPAPFKPVIVRPTLA
jgi:hypothetical protein